MVAAVRQLDGAVEGNGMRRKLAGTPPLSPAVVAIVLSGWSAEPPKGESTSDGVFALGGNWGCASPGDDDGVFDLFQSNEVGVIRVWRRHQAFLLSEARRLGIQPKYAHKGQRLYFGQ